MKRSNQNKNWLAHLKRNTYTSFYDKHNCLSNWFRLYSFQIRNRIAEATKRD